MLAPAAGAASDPSAQFNPVGADVRICDSFAALEQRTCRFRHRDEI
jgi:hypothetical protein